MRSRTLSLTLGAAVLVGGGIFGVTPAQAAEPQCPKGALCLYEDIDFKKAKQEAWLSAGTRYHDLGQINDWVSSIANNTEFVVRVYQDKNEKGKYIKLYPGDALSDLRSVVIYNADGSYFGVNTFNDRASSIWASYG
ncbi:peptidase inhibitor family I36 protein [Streptomyces sp. ISID311]|uniref:peptidase inhibitor family I36 protein n=1 Tax=Streptomyces sp. ISID311 TaxID=2601673 RepID=UPI0011BD2FB2|nr:peptidase inhibitor family I36 protein [Streptomyces sp. ISID311]TXC95094.1 hypothetical protein FS847_24500 [Streptomyces sp. ISID311]